MKTGKKPIYKKWWFWVIIALIVLPFGAMGGKNGTEANSQTNPDNASSAEEQTLDGLLLNLDGAIAETEVGSTERADAIISQARSDAETPSENIGNEAASFIVSAYPDFYDSTEIMEKVIYCGAYLEYCNFNEASMKIGMDVVQAVKYVYRGAETIEDTGTQENLKQIGDALSEAGLI